MKGSEDFPLREEIFRAARLCAPSPEQLGKLTFGDQPASAVETWAQAVFLRHLVPAAVEARAAVTTGGVRELAAIDARLEATLVGPAARRSRDAGRFLAAEVTTPPGERGLARHTAAVVAGEVPGHFVTIFSARAAVFHIPPRVALGALVFLELRDLPMASVWPGVGTCLAGLPGDFAILRAA